MTGPSQLYTHAGDNKNKYTSCWSNKVTQQEQEQEKPKSDQQQHEINTSLSDVNTSQVKRRPPLKSSSHLSFTPI